MRSQTKEPLFNSKELNKILPSYLLDEIDEDNKYQNHSNENQVCDLVHQKENKKGKPSYKLELYKDTNKDGVVNFKDKAIFTGVL